MQLLHTITEEILSNICWFNHSIFWYYYKKKMLGDILRNNISRSELSSHQTNFKQYMLV